MKDALPFAIAPIVDPSRAIDYKNNGQYGADFGINGSDPETRFTPLAAYQAGSSVIEALVERGWTDVYLNSEAIIPRQPGYRALGEHFGLKLVFIKPDEEQGPNQSATYAVCHHQNDAPKTIEIVGGDYADEDGIPSPSFVYDLASTYVQPYCSGYPERSVDIVEAGAIYMVDEAICAAVLDARELWAESVRRTLQ